MPEAPKPAYILVTDSTLSTSLITPFEGDFLLCRCTEDWDVLGVSGHASLAEARESAERTYRGISARWLPFRELTSEERAEVEEVRVEAERVRREGLIGGAGEV